MSGLTGRNFLRTAFTLSLSSGLIRVPLSVLCSSHSSYPLSLAGLLSCVPTSLNDARATRAAVALTLCSKASQVSEDTSQPSPPSPPLESLLKPKRGFCNKVTGTRSPTRSIQEQTWSGKGKLQGASGFHRPVCFSSLPSCSGLHLLRQTSSLQIGGAKCFLLLVPEREKRSLQQLLCSHTACGLQRSPPALPQFQHQFWGKKSDWRSLGQMSTSAPISGGSHQV